MTPQRITRRALMKRSKAYRKADELIEAARLYTPAEAVTLARKTSTTKFDPTVEVALRLGGDPRQADPMVPGRAQGRPEGPRAREPAERDGQDGPRPGVRDRRPGHGGRGRRRRLRGLGRP